MKFDSIYPFRWSATTAFIMMTMFLSAWFMILLIQYGVFSDYEKHCDPNFKDCIDMDYLAEESAKDTVITYEIKSDVGTKVNRLALLMQMSQSSIWKEWWKEWHLDPLPSEKPTGHMKPLCQPFKNRTLVTCNDTSSTDYACTGVEKGIVEKCNIFKNAEFTIPICLEEASKKIVSCGKFFSVYLCAPNASNETISSPKPKLSPMRPCRKSNRHICLTNKGYLDVCERMVLLTTQATPQMEKQQPSNITELQECNDWSKEWTTHILGLVKNQPSNNRKRLCLPEEDSDRLVDCSKNDSLPSACVKTRYGEIRACLNISEKDMKMNICIEETTDKLINCYESGRSTGYLCYPSAEGSKAVTLCQLEHRQLCLRNNGSIEKCIADTKIRKNTNFDPLDNLSKWEEWWRSWITTEKPTDQKTKIKKLESGKTKTFFIKLKPAAKNGKDTQDKVASKTKISHGNRGVYPVNLRVMSNESNVSEREEKLKLEGDLQKQTKICISVSDKRKVAFCNSTLLENDLCVSVLNYTVDKCSKYNESDMPIPVCVEESSKKIVTCKGQYESARLCFKRNLTSLEKSTVFPCRIESLQKCLNDRWKIGTCSRDLRSFLKAKLSSLDFFRRRTRSLPEIFEFPKFLYPYPPHVEDWRESERIRTHMLPMEANNNLKNESNWLCKKNETGDRLMLCQKGLSQSKACISRKQGEIRDCKSFKEQDVPVQICSEKDSNKLITCDQDTKMILCLMDSERNRVHVKPCGVDERQACLDTATGEIKRCTESNRRYAREKKKNLNSKNDTQFWKDWWKEWETPKGGFKMKNPERVMKYLCLTGNNDVFQCTRVSPTRACMSAQYGYIGMCKNLKDSEKPVQICMEAFAEKIFTCGRNRRAYVCYPPNGGLSPKKPCHDESRHMCYAKRLFQNCEVAKMYKNGRLQLRHVNWPLDNDRKETVDEISSRFKYSNPQPVVQRPVSANATQKFSGFLCALDDTSIAECPQGMFQNRLCLSAPDWKIGLCGNETDKVFAPICAEVFTKRIVTCGMFPPIFLCFGNRKEELPVRPCESSDQHICLRENGTLGDCSISFRNIGALMRSLRPAVNIFNEKVKLSDLSDEGETLCSALGNDNVLPCISDPSLSVKCLNTNTWNLTLCQQNVKDSEVGLAVCVERATSKLQTCDTFSKATLCYQSEKYSYPLIPCKQESKMVCIAKTGIVTRCSKILNQDRLDVHKYKSYTSAGVKLNEVTEKLHESTERLCFFKERKKLLPCFKDTFRNFACLATKSGKIRTCDENKRFQMHIPVCILVATNALVTCGRFNRVNLCVPNFERRGYFPCGFSEQHACLKNGVIRKCVSKDFPIRKPREAYTESKEHFQIYAFDNIGSIIDYEVQVIERFMHDTPLLCAHEKKFYICTDDEDIRFACFDPKEGKIKECDRFKKTQLILPICMQETSKRVLACGKFTSVNLCASESQKIGLCEDNSFPLCLSKNSVKKCEEENYRIARNVGLYEDRDKNADRGEGNQAEEGISRDEANAKEDEGYIEYDEKKRDEVNEKIMSMIEKTHLENKYLCIQGSQKQLLNCDSAKKMEFACIGATSGEIKKCGSSMEDKKDDLDVPICVQENTKNLGTCDIVSNVKLCLKGKSKIGPCISKRHRRACLADDGRPNICDKKLMHFQVAAKPNNEEPKKGDTKQNEQAGKQPRKGKTNEKSLEQEPTEKERKNEESTEEVTEQESKEEELAVDDLTEEKSAVDDLTEEESAVDDLTEEESAVDDLTEEESAVDDLTEEESAVDDLTEEESAVDDLIDEDSTEEEPSDEEAAEEPTEEESTREESAEDEPIEEEPIEEETTEEESIDKESEEDESTEDEPIEEEPTEEESEEKEPMEEEPTEASTEEEPNDKELTYKNENVKLDNTEQDEKFMRLNCHDCSIENYLIVEGNPKDVLPEAEVITFQ